MRCTAVPSGPSRRRRVRADGELDVEPGAAVLVDQAREVGGPRQRRVGAPLVGAQGGHRGPDLVEARPTDRLRVDEGAIGLVEVAAQHVTGAGDVEEDGGQGVAGQVVELAGDAAALLGDRLFGQGALRLLELVDEKSLPPQEPTHGGR